MASVFTEQKKGALVLSKDFTSSVHLTIQSLLCSTYFEIAPLIHFEDGKPSSKEVVQRRATLEGAKTAGFVQDDGLHWPMQILAVTLPYYLQEQ